MPYINYENEFLDELRHAEEDSFYFRKSVECFAANSCLMTESDMNFILKKIQRLQESLVDLTLGIERQKEKGSEWLPISF